MACTTWCEYNGGRFGEQTFVLETGASDYASFLQSLQKAVHSYPGFHATLQPCSGDAAANPEWEGLTSAR